MTDGAEQTASRTSTPTSRWLFRIGLVVVVAGFVVQMFSGYTYTVASPDDCPPTWEGEDVSWTEVLDRSGNPAGYWCLIQGSFTQTNEPRFHNIPVGVRAGYAQWYGFAVMLVGVGLIGASFLARRSTSEPDGGSAIGGSTPD